MSTDSLDLFPENQNITAEQAEQNLVREQYRARLAEKLKDPEFRKIEGFPIGTDEAILALSDPPYYTACPNPFIEEWLTANAKPYDAATDDYHREPFAADVSEGKNDPIYNAHSYHTKVPHKAIMRYILHYTEPGDVVYDGFCGTGMTGVAAQMCGDKAQVESLGYKVRADGTILNEEGHPFSKFGARKAILNDLSPAATFIAYNYNMPVDAQVFEREAKRILKAIENECGWMYSTLHDASPGETERLAEAVRACQNADELRALCNDLQTQKSPMRDANSKLQLGRINYTVWSDVFICPNCGNEVVFWDAAIDKSAKKIHDVFQCPSCRSDINKQTRERAYLSHYDAQQGIVVQQSKQIPVQISYTGGKQRVERELLQYDLAVLQKLDELPYPDWIAAEPVMGKGERWGDTWRAGYCVGITHTHHFFAQRNLRVVAAAFAKSRDWPVLMLSLTGILQSVTRMYRWTFDYIGGGPLSGTIYFPALLRDISALDALGRFITKLTRLHQLRMFQSGTAIVSVGSASQVTAISENTADYIFTDPPFGGNLAYSELSFLWEAWLRVKTTNDCEAITSQAQHKSLPEYQKLMTKCFAEYYRILKPGHWMTVEFHNSANSVWNSIQEGLERVGFVVADIRALDKKHNSFNQANASSAVKADLVISCYKPRNAFEERFRQVQGRPEGVIEFVREHLAMLPVAPINKVGHLETVAERTRFLLFDRMVAYHLQKGARIPLSAADFYKLLEEQFVERDEMYFLNEQSARYDAVKARGVETEQLSIFVRDEKTAVQWVRSRLSEQPQTLGDLTPKFMQELREWESHEPRPELRDLLKEYFIEGGGVWRVPDPNNEKDLELLRRNALLRLFREYTTAKGPLKVFRKEAVLEGFRHCWETQQYGVIVAVCEKIPEKILQEIQEFVMMYDVAKDLAPTQEPQTAFVWE